MAERVGLLRAARFGALTRIKCSHCHRGARTGNRADELRVLVTRSPAARTRLGLDIGVQTEEIVRVVNALDLTESWVVDAKRGPDFFRPVILCQVIDVGGAL
jgi:hypothetical protein